VVNSKFPLPIAARPALPVPVSSYMSQMRSSLGNVQLQWKNSLDYNGLTSQQHRYMW